MTASRPNYLEPPETTMLQFSESTDLLDDIDALRRRLDKDSYLFFRGLLSAADVSHVRTCITDVLRRRGWLAGHARADHGPVTSTARRENHRDDEWLQTYTELQSVQAFHELAYSEPLTKVMSGLLDEPLLVHPRKMLRLALPDDLDDATPSHQDYRVVQGAVDVLTAWLPLGPIPPRLGGLAILPGSANRGVQRVHYDAGPFGQSIGMAPDETWATGELSLGDVLIFHSLTIHAGLRNESDEVRISVDYRYQRASDEIITGSLLPYYYPWIPGWEELTADWTNRQSISKPTHPRVGITFDPRGANVNSPPSRLISVRAVR